MKFSVFSAIILPILALRVEAKDCQGRKLTTSKLVCYFSKVDHVANACQCSHAILPANADVKSIDRVRELVKDVKVLVTVNQFNQGLVNLLESSKVDGVEIDLHKFDSKSDISDFISTVRSKLSDNLFVAISVPARAEILAKYFDFKALSKSADLFILQTAFLGASHNVTFHPSRLSGIWDMQNTDSVVDLVGGLGAPLSKLVVAAPVQAFQFKLQNDSFTAPGSPALEIKSITRDELCRRMGAKAANWTLERDLDQAGPYIFNKDQWIAFEDATSMDIKAKYSRVRGLAGLALKDVSQDGGLDCGPSILEAAFIGLSKQARAPRGAVLHSLQREILETPARPLDTVQVSPYRITRVIDTEGHIHSIREDTRTEFECSRQGYFVHPRSCNRFYRCVKFDQLSEEFNVFEFDCPAGLVFDERVEVCVWPGSLPHTSACAGSSEIAPVPKERFICPQDPGYYADPENCRWFFACLDHGKSPLSAYEFRCPFGLVFDEERLLCEWPWLVPKCGNGAALGISLDTQYFYGGHSTAGLNSGNQNLKYGKIENFNYGTGDLNSGIGGLNSGNGNLQSGIGNLQSGIVELNHGTVPLAGIHSAIDINTGLSLDSKSGSPGANLHSGGYNQAILLDQYTGLGPLGTISLGGIKGTLKQPIARIYSNVGLRNDGAYLGQVNGAAFGLNGLSYNAAQSLQNAGLIRGVGVAGHLYEAGLATSNHAVKLGLNAAGAYVNEGLESGIDSNLETVNQFESTRSLGNLGSQYEVGTAGIGGNSYTSSVYGSGGLLNYQTGILGSLENGNLYPSSGRILDSSLYGSGNLDTAKSSQSFTQIHSGSSGTLGNINIIGGGYSAVGIKSAGVEISNNGESYAAVSQVTPIPVTSTTVTPIPAVTSVPLPTIKTVTSFESINGGVVANVPELQYKFNAVPAVNFTTGYNILSSPKSFTGYEYKKPAVQFVEGVTAKVQPVVFEASTPATLLPSINKGYSYQEQDHSGYVYNKPAVSFEETPVRLQPVVQTGYVYEKAKTTIVSPKITYASTVKPTESIEEHLIYSTVKPVVSKTVQKFDSLSGYEYKKPVVAFEEKPQVLLKTYNEISTVKPQVYVQPQIISSTSIPIIEHQPAVSYNYHQQVKSEGYHYEKPVVAFQEVPLQEKQVVSTYQPISIQQPVSTYNFQNVVKQVGYSYPKPAVAFEEKPAIVSYSTPKPVVVQQHLGYSYQKPKVVFEEKPAVTYSYVTPKPAVVVQKQEIGYNYPKPQVVFEEKPAATYNYVTPKPAVVVQKQEISYNYPKPQVSFEEKPAVTYNYVTPKPAVVVQKQEIGYNYPKPQVVFEEKPAVTYNYITPKPVVQQSISYNYVTPKPTIVEKQDIGYTYSKPQVAFKEKPAVTYNYITPKPAVTVQKQEIGYNYPKPQVVFEEKPAVTYNYVTPKPAVSIQKQTVHNVGYTYSKPKVVFEEKPVFVQKPTTSKPAVLIQQQNIGYTYPKPQVVFEEKPAVTYNYVTPKPTFINTVSAVTPAPVKVSSYVKPAVISSYSYSAPTIKPVVVQQQPIQTYNYVQPTPIKPVINYVAHQPSVASSYSYAAPTIKPVVVQKEKSYLPPPQPTYVTYSTVKPAVATNYDYVAQILQKEYLPPQKPAVVTNYNYVSTVKPVVIQKEQKAYLPPSLPTVVTYSTPKPTSIVENYNYVAPVKQQIQTIKYQTPKPAVVSTYSYVAPTTKPAVVIQKEFQGYDYPKPNVAFVEQPKPVITYENRQPVVEVPFVKEKTYVTGQVKQQVVVENYQAPANFYFVDKSKSTTSTPVYQEYYQTEQPRFRIIETTPKPTFLSTIQTIATKTAPVTPVFIESTTSRPIVRYSFSSLDRKYQTTAAPVFVSEPVKEYLPVKIKSTTFAPIVVDEYLPAKIRRPVTTTEIPTREYLPVKSKVRITTTSAPRIVENYVSPTIKYAPITEPTKEYLPVIVPSKKYLPVTTTFKPTTLSREYLPARKIKVTTTTASDEYIEEVEVTTRRPAKVVKIVRPKSKAVVKVNDFHPMLSTKLGAQCTCVSNKVKLRKRPQKIKIEIQDEDDGNDDIEDDEDVYVVADKETKIVEEYNYDPKKVEVTSNARPTEVVITSSPPTLRKRLRVRPQPVTEAVEVFVRKQYEDDDDDKPSDREIAKAVRTGLKLVKQAAKEGAAEAIESHTFDRYGPGGLRSRSETLQGTIDCQRAGLFRHPTQCNKFYACRWDEKKKRFTLHVFNCPVHLTFDNNLGACNWPSQGPACLENTLLPNN